MDNYGCSETITIQDLIQVFPNPVANFKMNPPHGSSLTNALIQFTDQSIGANHWLWDLGDQMNSQSSLQNPSFTYNLPGYYTAMLLVTNSDHCTDTVSHMMYIEPEFTIHIPNAFTPNCPGHCIIGLLFQRLLPFPFLCELSYSLSRKDICSIFKPHYIFNCFCFFI